MPLVVTLLALVCLPQLSLVLLAVVLIWALLCPVVLLVPILDLVPLLEPLTTGLGLLVEVWVLVEGLAWVPTLDREH